MKIKQPTLLTQPSPEKEYDFIIAEYEQLSSHIRSFWQMRLSVIIASLGALGYLVKFLMIDLKDSRYEDIAPALALLILNFYAALSITSSLTRILWFFALRMESIAKRFTEKEFWTSWNAMPRSNPRISSLHPYYSLFHVLNLLISMIVLIQMISIGNTLWHFSHFIAILTSICLLLIGARSVKNMLHVKRILDKIRADAPGFQ